MSWISEKIKLEEARERSDRTKMKIETDNINIARRQEAATPTNTAMRMFQNKDRTGNELLDSSLPTTHQNQV